MCIFRFHFLAQNRPKILSRLAKIGPNSPKWPNLLIKRYKLPIHTGYRILDFGNQFLEKNLNFIVSVSFWPYILPKMAHFSLIFTSRDKGVVPT